MAVQGRIPVVHEAVFTAPVILMSVDPVENFELVKAARASGQAGADVQERDRDTGERLWAVSVIDPTAPAGRREIKVKIPAEVQPVPPQAPGHPVEFEGLMVIPYVDSNRARPRVAIAYRASGFRSKNRGATGAGAGAGA